MSEMTRGIGNETKTAITIETATEKGTGLEVAETVKEVIETGTGAEGRGQGEMTAEIVITTVVGINAAGAEMTSAEAITQARTGHPANHVAPKMIVDREEAVQDKTLTIGIATETAGIGGTIAAHKQEKREGTKFIP